MMTMCAAPGPEALETWLTAAAFPLWAGAGVDQHTGTVWEALDHSGAPLPDLERRLRVQVRQAFCFAQSKDPAHQALALRLFRFAMDRGFDPATGHLASRLTPGAEIARVAHDLYDMAFMLLAAAALISAGHDVTADLTRLEASLATLKAPRGWHEDAAHSLPRRQNPHMHLFEAMTALFEATGAPRFRQMAEECLGLFRDVFLTGDGCVFEFFDADWRPVAGPAQAIEPGHMAEWVYLIHRFEEVTGQGTGLPLEQIFAAAAARRDAGGLLPDVSDPDCGTRRTWPQTEMLKAALVMRARGAAPAEGCAPETVLAQMWGAYFKTPVPGGWYDMRAADGALLSQNMPASTFYHIVVALRFYIAQARVSALRRASRL